MIRVLTRSLMHKLDLRVSLNDQISRKVRMLTTMIQPLQAHTMLVPTLMVVIPMESRTHIQIMILQLVQRRKILSLLLRRDTGGMRNLRRSSLALLVQVKLMPLQASVVPFHSKMVSSTAKLSALLARK